MRNVSMEPTLLADSKVGRKSANEAER